MSDMNHRIAVLEAELRAARDAEELAYTQLRSYSEVLDAALYREIGLRARTAGLEAKLRSADEAYRARCLESVRRIGPPIVPLLGFFSSRLVPDELHFYCVACGAPGSILLVGDSAAHSHPMLCRDCLDAEGVSAGGQ